MTWLATLLAKLVIGVVELFVKKAEKPKELEDAKTPDNVRADWNKYITDKLRDKDGGH